MKPFNKIKHIDYRWAEPLGEKECPYAYRWVLVVFGYSLRIHHFLRSDDKRYLHDHAWDFITFILKGYYHDVSEKGSVLRTAGRFYRVTAEHAHYVDVPKGGCWTLVFAFKPRRKWGFHVNGKLFRPLRYFHKYGHPPCDEQ